MLKTCREGTSLTPQGKNMLDFETVVGMYVQMETFEQGGVAAVSANRRGWEGYPSSFGGQRAENGS